MNAILFPLRVIGVAVNLVLLLVMSAAGAGFVLSKGSQPMGVVGSDPKSLSADLGRVTYWEFMSSQLAASAETPANCHSTRLVFLAVAIPLYPALNTGVALYPESRLAWHTQSHPLIPDSVSWQQVPGTWWTLVKEVSWLAFTQPQWDFVPGVGQKVRVGSRCTGSITPGWE